MTRNTASRNLPGSGCVPREQRNENTQTFKLSIITKPNKLMGQSLSKSRGGAVGIATGYRVDCSGTEFESR
jgi:hypothetical protein